MSGELPDLSLYNPLFCSAVLPFIQEYGFTPENQVELSFE
jgi:hypothetical protein